MIIRNRNALLLNVSVTHANRKVNIGQLIVISLVLMSNKQS